MQENGPHQLKKQTNKQTNKIQKKTNSDEQDFNSRALFDWTILRAVNYPIRPAKYPFPLVHASQPHRYDTKLEVFLMNCFNLNRFRAP